jgi:hypothetical protein
VISFEAARAKRDGRPADRISEFAYIAECMIEARRQGRPEPRLAEIMAQRKLSPDGEHQVSQSTRLSKMLMEARRQGKTIPLEYFQPVTSGRAALRLAVVDGKAVQP